MSTLYSRLSLKLSSSSVWASILGVTRHTATITQTFTRTVFPTMPIGTTVGAAHEHQRISLRRFGLVGQSSSRRTLPLCGGSITGITSCWSCVRHCASCGLQLGVDMMVDSDVVSSSNRAFHQRVSLNWSEAMAHQARSRSELRGLEVPSAVSNEVHRVLSGPWSGGSHHNPVYDERFCGGGWGW